MTEWTDKVTEKYVKYINAKKQEKAFNLELRIMALNKMKEKNCSEKYLNDVTGTHLTTCLYIYRIIW